MKSDLQFENIDLPSVSIVKILPNLSKRELFSRKRCYIGISLDNPEFYGKSLQALVLWGIGNFGQCLVVVGDHLRRFNEQIFNGLEYSEAVKVANALGDSFIDKAGGFFGQIPTKRLMMTRWKQCLLSDEYKKSREILDELFEKDSAFKSAVEKDAFSFARRQTKRNKALAVTMEVAIELSCRYLLEEVAVFSALSEQGWSVELYPGPELHVLSEVAKSAFINVPQGLKERINVELKISDQKTERI